MVSVHVPFIRQNGQNLKNILLLRIQQQLDEPLKPLMCSQSHKMTNDNDKMIKCSPQYFPSTHFIPYEQLVVFFNAPLKQMSVLEENHHFGGEPFKYRNIF